MSTLKLTEFNRSPSEAAQAERRDGIVVITNHGVPTFDLVLHRHSELMLREMSIAEGVTIPAHAAQGFDAELFRPVLRDAGVDINELIAEVDGDH